MKSPMSADGWPSPWVSRHVTDLDCFFYFSKAREAVQMAIDSHGGIVGTLREFLTRHAPVIHLVAIILEVKM